MTLIPTSLINKIKKGRAALFLGSGALFGAKLQDNKKIPLGNDLRNLLNKEFLEGEFPNETLMYVSEMAISAYSLRDVQEFIADYFLGISPADFHLQIPLFKWPAIFSTNYDRLIETCYQQVNERAQELKTFISDEQDLQKATFSDRELPYIKLHGCITRTNDEELPLILTTEQYNDYKSNRNGLFKYLYELAYQNSIVFVGHSLQDSNIRAVLQQVHREAPNGERHYLLKPNLKRAEIDLWAQKKITAIDITFEKFMEELCTEIDENHRILPLAVSNSSHFIQKFFNSNVEPSDELIQSIKVDFQVLTESMSVPACNAIDFFKGVDQDWSPIAENIAIQRSLGYEIFSDIIEKAESERKVNVDFYVIKGEAGSGKTVLLRQIAWKTMEARIGIPIWVNFDRSVDPEHIEELSRKSGERIFIFWDDAANNSVEMTKFIEKVISKKLKVTLITTERYNEWNMRCEELDELITDKYSLRYLSEDEISKLAVSLEKHNSLGPILSKKSHNEICDELKDKHGRQLLVALHEATMGEPFEEIIVNEYSNIFPESARSIYLTVCVLNRLRVPVRAGLISRIHDVTFEDFSEKFYKPLEKVVINKARSERDIYYLARHPEIAEIVFRRILKSNEERYNEYISILSKLNISFSSDKDSYRLLIKAKSLHELFPDYNDVNAIFIHAQKVFGDDPYLLQQMANYERFRNNGRIETSLELLLRAQDMAPYDSSILHSLAICWRDISEKTSDFIKKSKALNEARGYLQQIVKKWGDNPLVSSTLIELSILSLKNLLEQEDVTDKVINNCIRNIQQELIENKRKFPSTGHIHIQEASLAELLNDNETAYKAMERAFEENDREPYLAIRLSTIFLTSNRIEEAKSILEKALERRRAHHNLNFHYAELLRNYINSKPSELVYYYRRAFTPGDRNYQAQFWFARYSYIHTTPKEHEDAKEIFEYVRRGKFSFEDRHEIRDMDGGLDSPKVHQGTIIRKREGFGFINIDGYGYELFVPSKSVVDDLWGAMKEGDRVSFVLAFSFSGPFADQLRPE
ncbi:TPA: SIR2 family protein [Proteus mirabilis]|uniref:P-loop NTPase n=1 Tax=Proteus mirabilis TaxID=584 RepID=UPI0029C10A3A|nr:SIR2 family protein [Proteus mirabilis]